MNNNVNGAPNIETDGQEWPTNGWHNRMSDISETIFPQSLRLAMAQDAYKLQAYQSAMLAVGVKDKVVIDVGAGNGVLSIMAAQMGARRVFAVEVGNQAVRELEMRVTHEVARGTIRPNVIRVVNKSAMYLTDQDIPPHERADVLVSEWIGYLLFHEHIWPAVCHVRDNFMKESYDIIPCKGLVQVAGLPEGGKHVLGHRKKVGVCSVSLQDFSVLMPSYYKTVKVAELQNVDVATDEVEVQRFDFRSVGPDAGDWRASFNLPLKSTYKSRDHVVLGGLLFTWKVDMVPEGLPQVVIDTGVRSGSAHWGQALVLLDPAAPCNVLRGRPARFKMRTMNQKPVLTRIAISYFPNQFQRPTSHVTLQRVITVSS